MNRSGRPDGRCLVGRRHHYTIRDFHGYQTRRGQYNAYLVPRQIMIDGQILFWRDDARASVINREIDPSFEPLEMTTWPPEVIAAKPER
jgi:hypothetical protein